MDYYFTIFTFVLVLFIFSNINGLKNKLDKIEKMIAEKSDTN